ncbi:hypothetical protein [Nocardioides sp.]|nr:hypothetical protein [Nocardioides sp.]MDO9457208.1 hypothetical protein [Nocardioides sp.]
MKLLRTGALAGLGKLAYDQARKPQNRARLKQAVAKARSKKRPDTR